MRIIQIIIVITNNEDVDIYMAKFDGITGNFNISSYDSFMLAKGDSFNIPVSFEFSSSNSGKTVGQDIVLYDLDGRSYTFSIWATSDPQPLYLYDSEDNIITEYDLEGWTDNRIYNLYVKNNGLTALNVISIAAPSGISLNSSSTFSLGIHETAEVIIYYNVSETSVDDNIVFTTDFNYDTTLSIPLTAGGELGIQITDSTNTVISSSLDFGVYSGDAITKSLTLNNILESEVDLDVTLVSDSFSQDLGDILVSSNGNVIFNITFLPALSGNYSSSFVLRDLNSNRSFTLNLTGSR